MDDDGSTVHGSSRRGTRSNLEIESEDEEGSVLGSVIGSVVSGLASNTLLQPNVNSYNKYHAFQYKPVLFIPLNPHKIKYLHSL